MFTECKGTEGGSIVQEDTNKTRLKPNDKKREGKKKELYKSLQRRKKIGMQSDTTKGREKRFLAQ
jgi:hypothetical protein